MSSALPISPAITQAPVAPPPAPRGCQWLDVATAARRSGLDERSIRRLCAKEWFARGVARMAAGAWEIRDDADVRLARVRFADDMPADLKSLTDANQKLVLAKCAIVKAWEQYTDRAVMRGMGMESATACFLEELEAGLLADVKLPGNMRLPSDRTLRNWRSAYRKDGLGGLIDERGTRQAKPTAEDPFFEHFRALYFKTSRLSVMLCWQQACQEAQISGWMPRSYKQTVRYKNSLPHDVVERFRKGKKSFDGNHSRHITRDYSTLKSNEIWCTDCHTFDCWVTYRGNLVRPTLTAFEDMRSRKIVGWHISAGSGNTDTVLQALHMGVTTHGLPEKIYADNGKENDNFAVQGRTKQMRFGKIQADPTVVSGVLGGLQIGITHAIAFNAKAKPVERAFGTLCDRFSKLQPCYAGNKPENRPPDLKAKLARGLAPSLEDFIAAFALWLDGDYHSRAHTGDAMDGRTPNAVFEKYLEVKRTAPPEILEVMLWKPSRPTKYTKDGVRFGGIGYGNRAPELDRYIGREVVVRVDRGNAGRVAVCETDGRFICFAMSNVKLPFNTTPEELREELAKIKRINKKAREAYQPRPRAVHDVSEQIYASRAQADRQARAAASLPAPTLVQADTPINDQLEQLRRSMDESNAPLKIASDEPAKERLPSMRELMAPLIREQEAKREREDEAERQLQADFRSAFNRPHHSDEAEAV